MATKKEIGKLLKAAKDHCIIHIPIENMISGGYGKCCWCGRESMYNGHDNPHYKNCLYHKLNKIA